MNILPIFAGEDVYLTSEELKKLKRPKPNEPMLRLEVWAQQEQEHAELWKVIILRWDGGSTCSSLYGKAFILMENLRLNNLAYPGTVEGLISDHWPYKKKS